LQGSLLDANVEVHLWKVTAQRTDFINTPINQPMRFEDLTFHLGFIEQRWSPYFCTTATGSQALRFSNLRNVKKRPF